MNKPVEAHGVEQTQLTTLLASTSVTLEKLENVVSDLDQQLKEQKNVADFILDKAISANAYRLFDPNNLTERELSILDFELTQAWKWLQENSDIGERLAEISYKLANTPRGIFNFAIDRLPKPQNGPNIKFNPPSEPVEEISVGGSYNIADGSIDINSNSNLFAEILKMVTLRRGNELKYMRVLIHELSHDNNSSLISTRNTFPTRVKGSANLFANITRRYVDNYALSAKLETILLNSGEWDLIREMLSEISCCEVGVSEYSFFGQSFSLVEISGSEQYPGAISVLNKDRTTALRIEEAILQLSELGVTSSALGASLRSTILEAMRGNGNKALSLQEILSILQEMRSEILNKKGLNHAILSELVDNFSAKSEIRLILIVKAIKQAVKGYYRTLAEDAGGVIPIYSDDISDMDNQGFHTFWDDYLLTKEEEPLLVSVVRVPDQNTISVKVRKAKIAENDYIQGSEKYSIVPIEQAVEMTEELRGKILGIPAIADHLTPTSDYTIKFTNS